MTAFEFGVVTKRQDRDETGFAVWEVEQLFDSLGIKRRFLKLAPDQEFIGLGVVDRLLCRFEFGDRLADLTVIPNDELEDALAMATYEFVDAETEELRATEDEIEARAIELMELRFEMLIKGDELAALTQG